MKKLILLFLCCVSISLSCQVNQSNNKSDGKPKILIGIISLKNMPTEVESIRKILREDYPNFSPSWIELLGKDNSTIKNGIVFLIESGCKFIISPDQAFAKKFSELSEQYPDIYFILIKPTIQNSAENNLFIINSPEAFKNILLEKSGYL